MFRGNSLRTFAYWGQEQRCPAWAPNLPEAAGRSSAAAIHAGPAKSKKDDVWPNRLPERLWGSARGQRDGREPGAPLPSLGRRKICFSFSACHENGRAYGWAPILATYTPIDNWPQDAVSFLSFIRELLSVYDLRFAGLCCVGSYCFPADTWHYV